jgi:threonine/homoserine/homoserine lactone efflux protein
MELSQRLLELTLLALVVWFAVSQAGSASSCFRKSQLRASGRMRTVDRLGVALLVLLLAQVALRSLGRI